MIICINSNSTYSASDWTIIQNNVDVMVGATTSTSGTKGLVPAPESGVSNRCLCSDGKWAALTAQDVKALPISGGTLTGNLNGKYITGTWLQTTAASNLGRAPVAIPVLDIDGWLYKRTPSELLSDIGGLASDGTVATATSITWGNFSDLA